MFRTRQVGIGFRLGLIVAVLLAGMAALAALDLGSARHSMRQDRAESTRRLVEAAGSLLGQFANEQDAGRLTRAQAQAAAKAAVAALRYDTNGYFWINDLDGRVLLHPVEPAGTISYSRLFVPWGWVIASGLYLDDVDAAVWRQACRQAGWLSLIASTAAGLAFLIVRNIVRPVRSLTAAMAELAAGNRDAEVPGSIGATRSAPWPPPYRCSSRA